MSEFVFISTIIFLLFALVWDKSTVLNLIIKVSFICMTVFGAYLLFGPTNLIQTLVK